MLGRIKNCNTFLKLADTVICTHYNIKIYIW